MTRSRLHLHFQPLDAALLLMTVIWGSNFTLVKLAVRDIPELPFNRGPRRAFSMSRSLATATQPALVSRSCRRRTAGVEQPPAAHRVGDVPACAVHSVSPFLCVMPFLRHLRYLRL